MYISSVSLPVNEPYQTLVSLRKSILCRYDNVTFSFLCFFWRMPGKRCFPAVTGYFLKMNSFPEKPPTDYLCTVERSSQYCMVEQASTYMNIDIDRKHFFYQKGLFDEMTALIKVALYQHILKTAFQGCCVRVRTRTGEMITKSSKL